eukprot:TRINITY_DN10830_c1_g1_i2.p1 TRINITY_DN10830_c1_g1~~TRINITY_DN10830_c1_g1_i2.p1  ORF type:complete len:311 (-),score=48.63 TRINITY_DN10830_c1_g1_i2:25-957(-)
MDNLAQETKELHWLYGAVACVAEYPAWVASMFGKSYSLSRDGKYTVRLYHPGQKAFIHIEVDDRIPVKDGGPVAAGISPAGEIWMPILEKAFAKFCGSYKNLQWGSTAYGLLYICGGGAAESWTRDHRSGVWKRSVTQWRGKADDTIVRKRAEGVVIDNVELWTDQIWLLLREYMEFCYPVACTLDPAQEEASGLLSGLAYSMLGAREVQLNSGILRMIRLRNPLGFTKWKGRWSPKSETWEKCPAAVNQLRYNPHGDGTFWISYSDFISYFSQIDVVRKPMPVQGCKAAKLQGAKRGLGKMNQYFPGRP